ncbi:PKD domain-containing protein [Candidatus Gracilibacteria bacterium]|nr:PKD domain-containing protein [Candidatus Gracilibacteria bacterium]
MFKKIFKKRVFSLSLRVFYFLFLALFVYIFSFGTSQTSSSVPKEYIANYKISSDREKIQQLLVEIESANKIGAEIPASKFGDLNSSFNSIFQYFPQDYDFKVVYQQCLTLSQDLSFGYTYNKLVSFMDNCYKPFKQILDKINTKYTVQAKGSANPKSGSAPLTVTLDARSSIDPSNETIPDKNYYRYYRNINGLDKTIGIGSVLNYTFDEPGNYLVHLTVRSSNSLDQGIFDGSQDISVDVSPKTASIVVYSNGKKLDKYEKVKIGIQEAQKGVIFDPSATIPMGGRILQTYKWEITSSDGFRYTKQGQGKPSIINVPLPGQGEFIVKLTIGDNENNENVESFFLLVSDPVAIIKQTPEKGNTSTTFSFDSSTSYSIVSSIRLFTREIFDENGDKVEMIQGKSIKKQFKKPGSYIVKLTVEDDLGQTNVDTVNILVESTEPIPQFSLTPTLLWKNPSQFVLDAGLSYDVDEMNGYDELFYERSFSNNKTVDTIDVQDNNKKITINFNEIGKQTIKLTVRDKFGKISELEKDIEIKSTLRPEITTSPKAGIWGNMVKFQVNANREIINYSWDFLDGESTTVQTNIVEHRFNKVGVYNVKLNVSDADGMQNEINELVFVGDKDVPIGAYKVQDKQNMTMTQNDICTLESDTKVFEYPAYKVDRYQDIRIDVNDSVNTKGEKNNLGFYFQPRDGEIYKQQQFSYKFDELGCNYIDFTVEDTAINKSSKQRIWFKVYNALPKVDNVILSYPQYGNEMGVGFNENSVKDIFNSELDPLIVKVSALNPSDSDGFISYYKRYYYYKDDPSRQLEIKVTPREIPYAFFSLPKMPGEFMFGVTMYDNDDGKHSSEEVLGNGPIVFFPPDVKKPDIPIVTLKSDKVSVEIGDEVTFDVISKIISDRADFVKDRTIQYDFDGDGNYDLTTKKDRVSYTYTTPNATGYVPRAAVLYRGYKGIAKGGNIIVKNGLKPRIMFKVYDRLVLFRDISVGELQEDYICTNVVDCSKGDEEFIFSGEGRHNIMFEYPDYKKYVLSMELKDKYANEVSKKRIIDVISGTEKSKDIEILSLPEMTESDAGTEIFVGDNLNNGVLFYIYYAGDKDCYVDRDISLDTDGDGNISNDKDFLCNEVKLVEYNPLYQAVIGRVFYQMEDKTLSKDFTVSFLDVGIDMDDETKILYQDIMKLINGLDVSIAGNQGLKTLLINLQRNIMDTMSLQSDLVAVGDYNKNNETKLTQNQTELMDSIMSRLSDRASVAAMGGNEYEQSKAEILNIIPFSLRGEVEDLFKQFESITGDFSNSQTQQDNRKDVLNKILSVIGEKVVVIQDGVELKSDEIDSMDMELIIMPDMCKIMDYYAIASDKCSSEEFKNVPSGVEVENVGMSKLVKTLLIVLGSLIGIFIIVVVVFAVKSKLTSSEEETEEI